MSGRIDARVTQTLTEGGEDRGSVALVGAGPGDPELLTLRAVRLLADADVVVHDALVGEGVLDLIPEAVERIDVGKRPGRPTPQEMISALLVELARQDRRVVRLKGGDPFVFGRGGEEAMALREADIRFEVVPGITSSVAAPAAAGIPVTHRGVSAAFTVVTGHRRAGEPDVDWRSLACVGGTIVVLMGVSQRATIAAELMHGGLAPETPVAAVQSATTHAQATGRWTLDGLADADIRSPAVIVIGAVAAYEFVDLHDAPFGADRPGPRHGRLARWISRPPLRSTTTLRYRLPDGAPRSATAPLRSGSAD